MPKRKTRDEFIAESAILHNGKYDYSNVVYFNNTTPVELICPIHGRFLQRPASHLNGSGCNKCGGTCKLSNQEFKEKANAVHCHKYDYSKTIYISGKRKIVIICPLHGDFEQTPHDHLGGHGCKLCKIESNADRCRMSYDEFVSRANEIHDCRYEYSKFIYKNSATKGIIICSLHGEFEQAPHHHLKGGGCAACVGLKPHSNESFIEKATLTHGNKYDYSLVKYVNTHTPVEIVCHKHGAFLQTPNCHMNRSHGCPTCAHEMIGDFCRLSQNEFINKCQEVHGYKYDYSKSIYKLNTEFVTIICPVHGEFEQKAGGHMAGRGCNRCGGSAEITSEEFFQRAIAKFNHDYTKTVYVNLRTKVTITCKKHGDFIRSPDGYLNSKYGCQRCGIETRAENAILTHEEFTSRCAAKHKNKYDYSSVTYKKCHSYIEIICPTHGPFKQKAMMHLSGQGCPKCSGNLPLTLEEFKTKAKTVHGNKYDYGIVDYKSNTKKIQIICPQHGAFWQKAGAHLRGSGCAICNESKGEKIIRLYLQNNSLSNKAQWRFKKSTISRKRFDFATNKGVIEYNGKQHYYPHSFGSKAKYADLQMLSKVIISDLTKSNWCKDHRIPLLVIPFWEYERITDLLDAFFAGQPLRISSPPANVAKYEKLRKAILAGETNLELLEIIRKSCEWTICSESAQNPSEIACLDSNDLE